MNRKLKIIISGGGTGGHIFPAIAIANALKNNQPDCEILFIGAKGKMEMEKVPAAGYSIKGLWISGFQRRFTIKNLMFPCKVFSSLWNARKIIKNFDPDVVVGVGGYASGPTLLIAAMMKIPTLIQEQNSFPGITNKILAKKVNKICVAYKGMNRFFPDDKIIIAGNPVRLDVIDLHNKKQNGYEYFGLESNKKTMLVVGGSLGARTINQSIEKALDLFVSNQLQIIWQTGQHFGEQARTSVEFYKGKGIITHEFISRMDLAYAVADIVVSRAGAMAISELCAVAKPVILVPSPNVAEDHQTKNALALVNSKAAIMIQDCDARDKLDSTIIHLLKNESLQKQLSENIVKLAYPEASQTIAKVILSLVK